MPPYGAVEIGGTKTDVVFGTSPEDMTAPVRIDTTSPEATLSAVVDVLKSERVDAVGIACFGPLDLVDGSIATTPKPGWSGTPVRRLIEEGCGAVVTLDSDVNGSALGEGRWGAATGLDRFVYVTVGTGIGAGVVIDGTPIGGREGHPEAGHIVVRRIAGDSREGSCPFHGDCLEGLASGPALEARFGPSAGWTSREGQVLATVAGYLAQGMRNLIYTVMPEMIIVGGGVSNLAGFHDRLGAETARYVAGYPTGVDVDWLITPPGLGDLSGLAGALLLAGAG